jgi:hypothetical protein
VSLAATLIGNVLLGLLVAAALVVAWGRPFRLAAEKDERAAALERLQHDCEQRAAWTNPHARPRGTGEPDGARRSGESPRLRLVGTPASEHVREANPAS